MNTEENNRFTPQTQVYLALIDDRNPNKVKTAVKQGVVEKDGGSYYAIKDAGSLNGIWEDTKVFATPLKASSYIRDECRRLLGELHHKAFTINLALDQNYKFWCHCQNISPE